MIKKLVGMSILMALFVNISFAQRVIKIEFKGLAHLSPAVAKEIIGINIGDEIKIDTIDNSIKKLFAQGYFKDISVDKRGGVLTYSVKEKIAIVKLEIKGYGSDDDKKKLLKGMGLKRGDLYDESKIKKAKKTIIEELEQKAYYNSVVEVTKKTSKKGSVALTFQVNKGEKITIKKLTFKGAKKLDKNNIEKDLANKERDFMGWLPWNDDGEVHIDQLEYDSFRAKNNYMKYGYLDATVSKPVMKVDFTNYKAFINYEVTEGIKYKVKEVKITHNLKELKKEEKKIFKKLMLKKGKVFNIDLMRQDIESLKEKVGNYGYAFAKVTPDIKKDTKKGLVTLNYIIKEGKIVTINDVIISGNDTTKDSVVRRYLYLAPKDKYKATDLKESKNALGRTGFFESVDIQTKRVDEEKIDLLVKVKETSTGTISIGGGYGSYEGLMFNASVSDKNLFGTGIGSSLGFEFSKISTSYNLSFTNPKIWDSMYSLGMSFYKRKYEYYNFTQDQIGGTITVGREFLRHYRASVGIGYVDNKSETNNNNILSSDGNVTFYDPYGFYNDKYQKTSLYLNLSYNNTDDFYTPREGMIASLALEFANLSGDDYNKTSGSGEENGYGTFLKSNLKLGFYYGLKDEIDYDLILRSKTRATIINSGDNNKLPIGEKLFMGGVGSVRGFNSFSLSPTDIYGNFIGGKKRVSQSLEASIPLSKEAKMRLTFFYDYGMIGEDSFTDVTRSSTGAMIEWLSPFGAINLVFAKALDAKSTDDTAIFEFSMGNRF